MQRFIRQTSQNAYGMAGVTDFVFVMTTSAACMAMLPLVGVTGQDWISGGSGATYTLNQPSFSADVFKVMDAGTERWLRFSRLVEEWREERGPTSSASQMAMTPAYQKIIGMGELAVPLILHQLKTEGSEPDHWFWALRAITGANPVSRTDRGNVRAMAKAWLKWGEDQDHAG